MPLARHDSIVKRFFDSNYVSTHMPLARHDADAGTVVQCDFKFLLTCLLRGMTRWRLSWDARSFVSTHMPLARHDQRFKDEIYFLNVSTHMPLARHDSRTMVMSVM